MSGTDIEDLEPGKRRVPIIVAVLIILTIFLTILGAAKAFGRYDEYAESPEAPTESRVYLTGDSIAYWSAPLIRQARPGWFIEAVPGRRVQTLSLQIAEILAADPNPRAIIVELGTNTAEFENYEGLYRDALASVPTGTKVVLVTPYRNPRKFDSDYEPHKRAFHQYYQAKAMNRLAQAEGVCVARWRYAAHHNPHLLHDGIHPTMRGRQVLTNLLLKTVRNCE